MKMLTKHQANVIRQSLLIAKEATDEKLERTRWRGFEDTYKHDLHIIEEAMEYLTYCEGNRYETNGRKLEKENDK